MQSSASKEPFHEQDSVQEVDSQNTLGSSSSSEMTNEGSSQNDIQTNASTNFNQQEQSTTSSNINENSSSLNQPKSPVKSGHELMQASQKGTSLQNEVRPMGVTHSKPPIPKNPVYLNMDIPIETMHNLNQMNINEHDIKDTNSNKPLLRSLNGVFQIACPYRRMGAAFVNLIILFLLLIPFIREFHVLSNNSQRFYDLSSVIITYVSHVSFFIALLTIYIFIQFAFIIYYGQTLGKLLFKIKVISNNGLQASFFRTFVIREMFFWALVIFFALITSNLVQLFGLGFRVNEGSFYFVIFVFSLINAFMTLSSKTFGKTLQDYFASTVVINNNFNKKTQETTSTSSKKQVQTKTQNKTKKNEHEQQNKQEHLKNSKNILSDGSSQKKAQANKQPNAKTKQDIQE